MSKYNGEFKLEVVTYYEKNMSSYKETAKHFGISDASIVRTWVNKYKIHGIKGLISNKSSYDGNFKKYVVEYMYENHLSLRETAYCFNLGHHQVVNKWAQIYREEGPQALFEEGRGRTKKNMSSKKGKNNQTIKETEKKFTC